MLFSFVTTVLEYPAVIFLWRWKRDLKLLLASVDSCFVILYPASGPAYSHCLSSRAAVATAHKSIQFLPCPHTRQTYQPLFIPCYELEWKMFGISSAPSIKGLPYP